MGRRDERRAARHRTFNVVAALVMVVLAVLGILTMQKASRNASGRLFRDPVETLKLLARLELTYKEGQGGKGGHGTYARLEDLVAAEVLEQIFVAGPVMGYRYRVTQATKDAFLVTAEPEGDPPPDPKKVGPDGTVAPATSGAVPVKRRYYAIDQTHTVRAHDDHVPGPNDEIQWSPRDSAPR